MDEQKYWRNIIAREIKAEHDRVKKYYSNRSANSGGISAEEQTRLNIFALCQSIAETYNEDIAPVNQAQKTTKPRAKKQAPAPEDVSVPVPTPVPAPTSKKATPQPRASTKKATPTKDKGKALQNEFGELI